MKKILLLSGVLYFTTIHAQEVMEASTEFQKTTQPGVKVELPYAPDVVEDAIKDYFNRLGVKADGSRGFQVFKSTKLGMHDAWNSDLYFKVERRGRKERAESVVYFFATPERQLPNLRKPGDYYGVEGARAMLKNMLASIEAYNLLMQIMQQEEEIKKTEKKFQRMADEGDDLDRKMKKLQENIQENKNDQAKLKQEIENQRKILEELRSKRK